MEPFQERSNKKKKYSIFLCPLTFHNVFCCATKYIVQDLSKRRIFCHKKSNPKAQKEKKKRKKIDPWNTIDKRMKILQYF